MENKVVVVTPFFYRTKTRETINNEALIITFIFYIRVKTLPYFCSLQSDEGYAYSRL